MDSFGSPSSLPVAWALSEDRAQRPRWEWIAGTVAIQIVAALLIVRMPLIWDIIGLANVAVAAIERAT